MRTTTPRHHFLSYCYLILPYCFTTRHHFFHIVILFRHIVVLYFSRYNKLTSFEEQHVYWNLLNLISAISSEKICVVHSFYYFPCSWISFSWSYLCNNWLISFFIPFLTKNPLCLIVESNSCCYQFLKWN